MRSLLDSLNDDFSAEIQQKQTFLDDAHAKLKDKTRELTNTRRNIHLLKEQTSTFEDLQQKSKNLDRAIHEEETRFFTLNPPTATTSTATPPWLPCPFQAPLTPTHP